MSFSAKKDRDETGDEYWSFLWIFANEPDRIAVLAALKGACEAAGLSSDVASSFTVDSVENRDWLAESYKALPPIIAGSFFIYGSHYDGTPPLDKIPLLIEAATAFGSGEHGTTSQCLAALEHLKNGGMVPQNILDMGCGSGILAAAAARLWPKAPVLAADNDPECVIVTKRHLAVNGLTQVKTAISEGYAAGSPVWSDAPYDLVIANILAAPLIDMAADQSRAVADGGHIILSGTLAGEQEARVRKAYEDQGFSHVKTFPKDEWATLLMRKSD